MTERGLDFYDRLVDRPQDRAAQVHFEGFRNRWFFDPVFGRGYPDEVQAYSDRGRIPSGRRASLHYLAGAAGRGARRRPTAAL